MLQRLAAVGLRWPYSGFCGFVQVGILQDFPGSMLSNLGGYKPSKSPRIGGSKEASLKTVHPKLLARVSFGVCELVECRSVDQDQLF